MGFEAQGAMLEIGTTAGAPVATVTAAVGFPTIITKVSHGLDDGDVVTLSAFAGASAALMNGFDVVVTNVTTDTLAVDINTVGGTLTAANGTLTPKVWQEIGEIVDWTGPSGTAAVIDVTHLKSTRKEKLMGVPDEGQFTFNINFVPADTGQIAAKAARATRVKKDFRVTYSTGATQTFDGFVLGFASSGGVDGKMAGSITVEITGEVVTTP